jgi:hypothetical protein
MLIFDNDELGYLRWVHDNPNGYVINVIKVGHVPYMLHKATCKDISTDQRTNYTTTTYMKICSLDRQASINYGRKNSINFNLCKRCRP